MWLQFAGRRAILDGEIVRPGPDGRLMFYELMRRRGPFCFYAFDLLWLEEICAISCCSSARDCFVSCCRNRFST
jgi:hypothetical protein